MPIPHSRTFPHAPVNASISARTVLQFSPFNRAASAFCVSAYTARRLPGRPRPHPVAAPHNAGQSTRCVCGPEFGRFTDNRKTSSPSTSAIRIPQDMIATAGSLDQFAEAALISSQALM